jgi:hypothetical protein
VGVFVVEIVAHAFLCQPITRRRRAPDRTAGWVHPA